MAQDNHTGKFLRYIDSADKHLENSPKTATLYLDSIPKPIDKKIKGHLSCYYQLRALISDRDEERILQYQNHLLTLKYAKLEKNYEAAGIASLKLYYNTSIIKRDSLKANAYLEDAQKYFELDNNLAGLADVSQMYAHKASDNRNYTKSNNILLDNLSNYKNIKDDVYYYMYALFMLTTNYLYLDDLTNAEKYFNEFQALEGTPNLYPYLYKSHQVTLYSRVGSYYVRNGDIEATQRYLSKLDTMKSAMDEVDERKYYNLYIDYYSLINNENTKNNYIDSLRIFEEKQVAKNLEATVKVNEVLLDSELALQGELKGKKVIKTWMIILLIALLIVGGFFIKRIKKSRKLTEELEKNTDEYDYLKTNHDKLKVKVEGMKDYIDVVKKQIKTISVLNNVSEQREKIKELYKDLQLTSSNFFYKSKSHLELINELNIEFFKKINNDHPELDDSEVIICYYLHMGFKNKEIAIFVNRSLRSIENKRFRIGKKLKLKEKNTDLLAYLQ
ncbi:helix-turn-helix transcriptional regulator [Kordia antarctica]|uniref:helix-turn-helix transcriptional regulator n=1 Tax=Kordia antarctica TaxID=1218801 RepID=UPI00135CF038|nr:hypothetical protein [Kordia antarctica]